MGRLGSSFRLARAGWVMAREGVIGGLPLSELGAGAAALQKAAKLIARKPKKSKQGADSGADNAANAMARAMHRLGPFYVKFGQFLATRPDIVGRQAARDLAALQDKVAPFPQEQAVTQLETTLSRPIEQIFSRLSAPIAAASMAQVHEGFVPAAGSEGKEEKRAVKILRPGLRRAFARDLQSFYLAARWAENHIAGMRRLRPVQVVENLQHITELEMDMRLEAAALSEMAENISRHGDTGFRVPKVDWERTGRECLTMEWIEGIRIADREALLAAGHSPELLAERLMQSFLRHALRDGFFHADMHPGNLFVEADGTIAAVDLGIMGRLGKKEQRFLAEILYGFITRDYQRVARVHFEAGYVPRHHSVESFAQANRAIGEPIYGQSVETISMARLLGLLFEVTELFDMQTRPELLLLQKNMVVVEGVARSLDPQFNMWKTAEPVVSRWVAQNLGVAGAAKDMADAAKAVSGLIRSAPELIRRAENASRALSAQAEHGVRLSRETVAELARAQGRQGRFLRLSVFVIALCCVILTVAALR